MFFLDIFSLISSIIMFCNFLSSQYVKLCKEDFAYTRTWNLLFQTVFPIHFVEHLRQIGIRKFIGEEDEIKLVEYILQHGKSLKKMTLYTVIEWQVSNLCNNNYLLKKNTNLYIAVNRVESIGTGNNSFLPESEVWGVFEKYKITN